MRGYGVGMDGPQFPGEVERDEPVIRNAQTQIKPPSAPLFQRVNSLEVNAEGEGQHWRKEIEDLRRRVQELEYALYGDQPRVMSTRLG